MAFIDTLKQTVRAHDVRMVELEFRLGIETKVLSTYPSNEYTMQFTTNIPKKDWVAAKEKLGTPTQETTTIDRYIKSTPGESSRYVMLPDGTGYWEHKKKIINETTTPEGKHYGVRSALALERRESGKPPGSYRSQRTKYRTSFTKGVWKIDFTRVESIPSKDRDCESTYEIEVELADIFYLFEKEIEIIAKEGQKLAQSILM